MLESVGKKLEQARLLKKLSVEEVAFATKIRPDRILDLEKDDYRNFPNLTYAKSFLTLYAKFLGVNVTEHTATLGKANPVGVGDYEYLSHNPEAPSSTLEVKQGRTLGSLILVVVLLLLGALGFYLLIGYQRLGQGVQTEPGLVAASPVKIPVPEPVQPEPAPEPTAQAAPEAVVPPEVSGFEVRRAEPVNTPEPAPTPALEVELIVEPLRRTWLRVQKNDLQAPSVFEGVVSSKTGLMTFKGTRFWVSVKDKRAVKITRGGVAVTEEDPLVIVQ